MIKKKKSNKKNNHKINTFNRKKLLIYLLIAIIILVPVIIILEKYNLNRICSTGSCIISEKEKLELSVGSSYKIKYTIKENEKVNIKWSSSNEQIATIDKEGNIEAIRVGTSTLTTTYKINDKKCQKKIIVTVIKNKNDQEKPLLNYNIINGKENKWTNQDVIIKINASDNSKNVDVKYTINCTKECNYTNLSNDYIKIDKEGINNVTIIASDYNGNSTQKNLKIRIDKTEPILNFDERINQTIYNNTGKQEICGTCYDELGECKKNLVCKTITKTTENIVLEVYDEAGNKFTSDPFNVVIDQEKPQCTLTVDKNGIIHATYKDTGGSELLYYGFNSNYKGSNVNTISVDKGKYSYYVKDKTNNVNTCSINVKTKNTNCMCKSGYEQINNYSTDSCLKYQGMPTWSEWKIISRQQVLITDAKTTDCSEESSICYDCTKKITDNTCEQVISKREKTICPTGTIKYNNKCYYEMDKICDISYYSE